MIWERLTYNPEYWILIAVALSFGILLLRQYLCNRAPEYIATATVLSRRLGTAGFHGKYSSGYNHLLTFSALRAKQIVICQLFTAMNTFHFAHLVSSRIFLL